MHWGVGNGGSLLKSKAVGPGEAQALILVPVPLRACWASASIFSCFNAVLILRTGD